MSNTTTRHPSSSVPAVTIGTGATIGAIAVGWMFVMGLTGWYLDPARFDLFWIVVIVQAVVLALLLRRLREGREYGAQVGIGLVASAVAAVVVFVGATLFTTVAFPDYFEELRLVREQVLRDAGTPEDAIRSTLDGIAASQTPTGYALATFMGMLGTGLVASLIAAAVFRDRRA